MCEKLWEWRGLIGMNKDDWSMWMQMIDQCECKWLIKIKINKIMNQLNTPQSLL